jgi:hypothetical protein
MDTNKRGKPLIYDHAFKIALAHEYLTTNQGYGTIAVKYNLPGADTVRYFVNWYKKNILKDYLKRVRQKNHH